MKIILLKLCALALLITSCDFVSTKNNGRSLASWQTGHEKYMCDQESLNPNEIEESKNTLEMLIENQSIIPWEIFDSIAREVKWCLGSRRFKKELAERYPIDPNELSKINVNNKRKVAGTESSSMGENVISKNGNSYLQLDLDRSEHQTRIAQDIRKVVESARQVQSQTRFWGGIGSTAIGQTASLLCMSGSLACMGGAPACMAGCAALGLGAAAGAQQLVGRLEQTTENATKAYIRLHSKGLVRTPREARDLERTLKYDSEQDRAHAKQKKRDFIARDFTDLLQADPTGELSELIFNNYMTYTDEEILSLKQEVSSQGTDISSLREDFRNKNKILKGDLKLLNGELAKVEESLYEIRVSMKGYGDFLDSLDFSNLSSADKKSVSTLIEDLIARENVDEKIKSGHYNLSVDLRSKTEDWIKRQSEIEEKISDVFKYSQWSEGLSGAANFFAATGHQDFANIAQGLSLFSGFMSNGALFGVPGYGIGAGTMIGGAFNVMSFAVGVLSRKKDAKTEMLKQLLAAVRDILENQIRILNGIGRLSEQVGFGFANLDMKISSLSRTVDVMHQLLYNNMFTDTYNICEQTISKLTEFTDDQNCITNCENSSCQVACEREGRGKLFSAFAYGHYNSQYIQCVDSLNRLISPINVTKQTINSRDSNLLYKFQPAQDGMLSNIDRLEYEIKIMDEYLKKHIIKDPQNPEVGVYSRELILGSAAIINHKYSDYLNKVIKIENESKFSIELEKSGSLPFFKDTLSLNPTEYLLDPIQILKLSEITSSIYAFGQLSGLNGLITPSQYLGMLKKTSWGDFLKASRLLTFLSAAQQNLLSGDLLIHELDKSWGYAPVVLQPFKVEDFAELVKTRTENGSISRKLEDLHLLLTNKTILNNLFRYRLYNLANAPNDYTRQNLEKLDPKTSSFDPSSFKSASLSNFRKKRVSSSRYRSIFESANGVASSKYLEEMFNTLNLKFVYDSDVKGWRAEMIVAQLPKEMWDMIKYSNNHLDMYIRMNSEFLPLELSDKDKSLGKMQEMSGVIKVRVPLPTPEEFDQGLFVQNVTVPYLVEAYRASNTEIDSYETYSKISLDERRKYNWSRIWAIQ